MRLWIVIFGAVILAWFATPCSAQAIRRMRIGCGHSCRSILCTSQSAEKEPTRKEKLDQRLVGKQILNCGQTVRKGDRFDDDVEFSEATYLDCRDTHSYFLEPYFVTSSPFNRGPFPKWTKVLHGLRIVQDENGGIIVIENYYAGAKHGQEVKFENGKRWYETNFEYGLRHGISRHYRGGGQIYIEEEFDKGRVAARRTFHENGQPSDRWVGAVLVEQRDEKGHLIKKK